MSAHPGSKTMGRVEQNSSLLLQVGVLAAVVAVAALLGTFPAMIRVSANLAGDAPVAQVRAWSALAAAAMGPIAITVVVLRAARRGLRAFAGPDMALRAFGAGLWLSLLFVLLALFGAVLRATTHHRALAGVTFGCGALALAIGLGLVCARIVGILKGASPGVRRVAIACLGALATAGIALVVLRFVLAVGSDPSSSEAATTVIDLFTFVLASVVASRDWRSGRRSLALVGPPLAVFLAALGIRTLLDASVRQAMAERAPGYAEIADLVSGQW